MDFEKIYNIYFKDVYKFLLSLTKNKEIAQDITSETFLKIINNEDKLENVENTKSYIISIAKNTYINYYNRNKKIIITEDIEDFIDAYESFEEKIINVDQEKNLYKAIEKLEEPYKSITKLRLEEMSFKKIGQIYNKTDNRACVCFYRAKEKLKVIMEEDYGL